MRATPEQRLDREIVVVGGVIVIGTIMAILDATIVNVAIPTLGRDFHTSVSTIQWVMTAYLLAFAAVIPLTGWASERFGAKRVWIAALLLFMAGFAPPRRAPSVQARDERGRRADAAGAGLRAGDRRRDRRRGELALDLLRQPAGRRRRRPARVAAASGGGAAARSSARSPRPRPAPPGPRDLRLRHVGGGLWSGSRLRSRAARNLAGARAGRAVRRTRV